MEANTQVEYWFAKQKTGQNTLFELSEFIKERAAIFEEVGTKLVKLSKAYHFPSECGVLEQVFNCLVKETYNVGVNHLSAGDSLGAALIKQIETFKLQQKDLTKNLKQKFKNVELEVNLTNAIVEFNKNNLDTLEIGSPQSAIIGEEYKKAVHLLETKTQYSTKVAQDLISEFEQLEQKRVQFIRNYLWKLSNLFSKECVAEDESYEKLRQNLEKCSPAKIIEDAALEYKKLPLFKQKKPQRFSNYNRPLDRFSNEFDNQNCSNNFQNKYEIESTFAVPKPPMSRQRSNTMSTPENIKNDNMFNSKGPQREISMKTQISANKAIKNDMINASIARSPILAGKRSTKTKPVKVYKPSENFSNPAPLGRQSSKYSETSSLNTNITNCSKPSHYEYNEGPHYEVYMEKGEYKTTPENKDHYISAKVSNMQRTLSDSNNYSQKYTPAPTYNQTIEAPQSISENAESTYNRPHSSLNSYYGQKTAQSNLPKISSNSRTMKTPSIQNEPIPNTPSEMLKPQTNLNNMKTGIKSNISSTPGGKKVLFCVKALYDYNAETDEEFSFKENDIIGVIHTQVDGWWDGVLLKSTVETEKGKTGIFPSNFTEPVISKIISQKKHQG